MVNKSGHRVQVFYRIVKAQPGHEFAGLYCVEKVFYKDGEFMKKQIVHEWDLRIISEAVLARLGGQDAYESFKLDHDGEDLALDPGTTESEARTAQDLTLSQRKLNKELRFKPESDGNK